MEVARYYYQMNLTQAEIGRRINASRSTVSRLLQQALDQGLVQITINYPWERAYNVEKQLCEKFHLREARVLCNKNRNDEETRTGMGVLAARYRIEQPCSGWYDSGDFVWPIVGEHQYFRR